MAALEYVTITGRLATIGVDYVDADTHPDELALSALVDFIPRLDAGTVLWCPTLTPPRGISIQGERGRFDTDGQLKTIQGGIGVELLACTAVLPIDELIYDVVFSRGQYGGEDLYLEAFAIKAPTAGGQTIDLSSVERLEPKPGIKPLTR